MAEYQCLVGQSSMTTILEEEERSEVEGNVNRE